MLNFIINNKLDLFSVNEKSIEYTFKTIISQREYFPPTTKAVLKEIVEVELRDLPFNGTISERKQLLEEKTEALITEYINEKGLQVINEKGEIIKPEPKEPDVEPTYDAEINCFFGNGRKLTITERADGLEGATVTWGTGSMNIDPKCNVFSGNHESDTVVENGSITMESGTVNILLNGGLHKSHCKNSIITLNGGTANIQGGPAASQKNCHKPHYTGDALQSTTSIDNGEVVINGGTVIYLLGGGNGISNTKNTKITVNNGTISDLVIGGTNGNTSTGNVTVNGGTIKNFSSTNRGTVGTVTSIISGGTIENVYAGGDSSYNDVTGTIDSVNLKITGTAKVTNLKVGTDGGVTIPTDKSSIVVSYKEGTVENVDESTFPNISLI